MSPLAENPLLQRIGIRSGLKHPDIVIRLQKKGVESDDIVNNVVIVHAKIGHDSDAFLPVPHDIRYRLRRIV